MRVVTNEALIKRYRTMSQILFFISLGGMGLGFFYTWTRPETSSQVSCMLLPLLFLMTLSSVRLANTWVREPRPVNVLSEALKGMGQKYTLFNHLLPAHHVLTGPEGVYVLHVVWQDNAYSVNGSKWSGDNGLMRKLNGYMRQDLLGNPFAEAQFEAQQVQKLLKKLAPSTQVEVQPLVVFIGANAAVTIQDPLYPVLYADDRKTPSLRDYLRDQKDAPRGALTDADLDAIDRAFGLMTREQVEGIESGALILDPATGSYYTASDVAVEDSANAAQSLSVEKVAAQIEEGGIPGTVYVVQGGQLYYIGATTGTVEDELPRLQEQTKHTLEIAHTLATTNASQLASRFQKRFERKQQKNNWYGLSQKDLSWLKSQRGQ